MCGTRSPRHSIEASLRSISHAQPIAASPRLSVAYGVAGAALAAEPAALYGNHRADTLECEQARPSFTAFLGTAPQKKSDNAAFPRGKR
ncbi:hypothetical protein OKW43_006958 [Paraburkholderia sp. WC7.3g]